MCSDHREVTRWPPEANLVIASDSDPSDQVSNPMSSASYVSKMAAPSFVLRPWQRCRRSVVEVWIGQPPGARSRQASKDVANNLALYFIYWANPAPYHRHVPNFIIRNFVLRRVAIAGRPCRQLC